MGWSWFQAYEGGALRRMGGGDNDRDFASQDIWANPTGAQVTRVTPHCGQYACELQPYGVTDYGLFRGHYSAKATGAGVKYWWCIRHRYRGFTAAPNATDIYHVAELFNNLTGPPTGYLEIMAVAVSASTSTDIIYKLYQGGVVKISHTQVSPSSTAWNWIVVEYDSGTGKINIGVAVGDGSISWATAVAEIVSSVYEEGIRPRTAFFASKAGDKGILSAYCCMGFCDNGAGAPTTAPPASTVVILHQPDGLSSGSGSGDTFTGSPDTISKWRNVDNENDGCPGDNPDSDYIQSPGTQPNSQTFGIVDAVGSPTIQAVRILFDQEMAAGAYRFDVMAGVSAGSLVAATDAGYGYWGTTGDAWAGRHYRQTPEATPVDWTLAKFNSLEAGLRNTANTLSKKSGEFYAIAIGTGLVRPDGAPCPPVTFIPQVIWI